MCPYVCMVVQQRNWQDPGVHNIYNSMKQQVLSFLLMLGLQDGLCGNMKAQGNGKTDIDS